MRSRDKQRKKRALDSVATKEADKRKREAAKKDAGIELEALRLRIELESKKEEGKTVTAGCV